VVHSVGGGSSKRMRILLLAAENVGLDVAAIMGDSDNPPTALVVDARESSPHTAALITAARVPMECVFTSDQLKEPAQIERLRALNPDLGILAWWPHVLRPPLLEVPLRGYVNTHPSLLPHGRGKHYNFWSIVEEAPFGVTLHWVTAGIDNGDIAFQRGIPTTWEDNGETLYKKAQTAIVSLFRDVFPDIVAGRIPRKPQSLAEGSFHRAAELEAASRVDLERRYSARELLNLLRARTFPPHPGAWFEDGGQRFEARVSIRRVE
jgi:methionyl-tRNA formyltransferase